MSEQVVAPELTTMLVELLDEVLDVIPEVRQASRVVSQDSALHAELAQLFENVTGWASRLVDQTVVLGASPLTTIPTFAGRTPRVPWGAKATESEIRQALGDLLARLADHLSAVISRIDLEQSRRLLIEIASGLQLHLLGFASLPEPPLSA